MTTYDPFLEHEHNEMSWEDKVDQDDKNVCYNERGVLYYPPLQQDNVFFELKGDNHVNRWVKSTQHLPHPTITTTSALVDAKHNYTGTKYGNLNNNNNNNIDYCLKEQPYELEEELEWEQQEQQKHENRFNRNNVSDKNSNFMTPSEHNSLHLLNGANITDLLQQVYSEFATCEESSSTQCRSPISEEQKYETDYLLRSTERNNNTFMTVERRAAETRMSESKNLQRLESASAFTSMVTGAEQEVSSELWVNKYAPRVFRDILIDDNISLRLLQWLKSWDAYVFGVRTSHNISGNKLIHVGGAPPTNASSSFKRARANEEATTSNSFSFASKNNKKEMNTMSFNTTEAASLSCSIKDIPEPRLIVLTGPPGVGKTSLVHVLASHCHYGVIEINASADRTTNQLESALRLVTSPLPPSSRVAQKVEHTLHNNTKSNENVITGVNINSKDRHYEIQENHNTTSLLKSSPSAVSTLTAEVANTQRSLSLLEHLTQPKLLLIDEIDGIANNVAEFIVNELIHKPIYRPVICCCNDWYASSLRQLRAQVTHVYRLPPLSPQKVALRLEEIFMKEEMLLHNEEEYTKHSSSNSENAKEQEEQMFKNQNASHFVNSTPRSTLMQYGKRVIAELVKVGNGDIRSCINTLQFIMSSSLLHKSSSSLSSMNRTPNASAMREMDVMHNLLHMVKVIHGKDVTNDLWQLWESIFNKLDRTSAIHKLSSEFNVNYNALIQEQTQVGTQQIKSIENSNDEYQHNTNTIGGIYSIKQITTSSMTNSSINTINNNKRHIFRVDPSYLYISHLLQSLSGSANDYSGGGNTSSSFTGMHNTNTIFIDGLYENYLLRSTYHDYTFSRTYHMADCFAFCHNVLSMAYNRASSLFNHVDDIQRMASLTCYVNCSSVYKPRKVNGMNGTFYPRLSASLHEMQTETLAIIDTFQNNIRGAIHLPASCSASSSSSLMTVSNNESKNNTITTLENKKMCTLSLLPFISHTSHETLITDWIPYLVLTLMSIDVAKQLTPSFCNNNSNIAAGISNNHYKNIYNTQNNHTKSASTSIVEQIQIMLERHALYGLTYAKQSDVYYTTFTSLVQKQMSYINGLRAEHKYNADSSTMSNDTNDYVSRWRLSPAIDKLLRRKVASARSNNAENVQSVVQTLREDCAEYLAHQIERYIVLHKGNVYKNEVKQNAECKHLKIDVNIFNKGNNNNSISLQMSDAITPTLQVGECKMETTEEERKVEPCESRETEINRNNAKDNDDKCKNAKITSTDVKPQKGLFALFQKHANKSNSCDAIKLEQHSDISSSSNISSMNANNYLINNRSFKASENKHNVKKGFVRYVYQDGATNAVKMTASVDDFL